MGTAESEMRFVSGSNAGRSGGATSVALKDDEDTALLLLRHTAATASKAEA